MANIIGTISDDTLFGSPDDDIIDGGAGNDYMQGGAGKEPVLPRHAREHDGGRLV